MKTPVPFPVGNLRWAPEWDDLRDEPRFQKLLADAQAAQAARQSQ
jgi:hypothetical protein